MSAITQVPFYPSDWLAGTRGMTAAQMGVYITLIALMYERAGPVRDDDMARLARLCGTSASALSGIISDLVDDGKLTRVDGGLFNRRAELEIKNVMSKSEVAREKANVRWGKSSTKSTEGECSGIAPAMQAISHKPEEEKEIDFQSISKKKISTASEDSGEPETPQTKPRQAFPAEGSIHYTPFADMIRAVRPAVDPDVVAAAFRRYAVGADPPIRFDDPKIGKRLVGFARAHRIGTLN